MSSYTFLALLSLCLSLAPLSQAETFDVDLSLTCAQWQDEAQTVCARWTTSGKVKEKTSCFPGQVRVLTPEGSKRMDELSMGDLILGWDSETQETTHVQVKAWLHRYPFLQMEYYHLTLSSNQTLLVSSYHNLAVWEDDQMTYQFPEEMKVGTVLVGKDGPQTLTHLKKEVHEGLYAPLTETSNYYVSEDGGFTLAHAFAHIRNPEKYETALHSIFSWAEWWDPEIHQVDTYNYFHPVAAKLEQTATILNILEGAPRPRSLRQNNDDDNRQEKENHLMLIMGIVHSILPPILNPTPPQ